MRAVNLPQEERVRSVKACKEDSCRHSSSTYDEETNNNPMVVESDSDSAHESHMSLKPPTMPSLIAKDVNSLTFQWEHAESVTDDDITYEVEMQQLENTNGTLATDPDSHAVFLDDNGWSLVYSGKECWTQVNALNPGQFYGTRIRCSIGNFEISDFSDVAVFHTTSTAPSKMQPPELVGLNHDSMKLKWDVPWEDGGLMITGFRLQMGPWNAKESQEFVDVYSGSEILYEVTGLLPSTKYCARIRAINEVGEGPWSSQSCFKTKPYFPDGPRQLTIISVSPTSVELDWKPAKQNGRVRDTYEIQIENLGRSFVQYIPLGLCSRYEVKGLDGGEEYRFHVRAENDVGKGPWSPPVQCRTLASTPGPVIPFITYSTANDVSCAWYPPQITGGKPVTKYQVEIMSIIQNVMEGVPQTWKVVYLGAELSCIVEDVKAGHEYLARVTAMNEAGWGVPASIRFRTPSGVPQAPLVPHAVERTSRTMRVYWIPPAHDGGMQIEAYRMQMCSANQLTSIEDSDPFEDVYDGPRNSVQLQDLMPGRVYAFRVCAVNAVGESLWSAVGYESTPQGAPTPPKTLRYEEREHRCQKFYVSWDMPEFDGGSKITRYDVAIAKDRIQNVGESKKKEENNNSNVDKKLHFEIVYSDTLQECVIDGLEANATYLIKIKAVNAYGESEWSPLLVAETTTSLPQPPRDIKVSEVEASRAYVSWRTSANAQSVAIETRRNDTTWMEMYSGKANDLWLKNLKAGTTYDIRARSINADGKGHFGETVSFRTLSTPPSIPDPPIVAQRTTNTLRVKWTAPEDNGDPIQTYLLDIVGDDGACYRENVPGIQTNVKLTELTPQTKYRLRLAAINGVGKSKWSKVAVDSTIPPAPLVPENVQVLVIETSPPKIEVAWDDADRRSKTKYEVEAIVAGSKKSKNALIQKAIVSDTKCILMGFDRGQKYEIRARAISEGVSGKWSIPITVRIPEDLPVPKTQFEVNSSNEETETVTARRIKKGQAIVSPKSRIPLKKRKSAWRILKPNVFLIVLFLFVSSLFYLLFLVQ